MAQSLGRHCGSPNQLDDRSNSIDYQQFNRSSQIHLSTDNQTKNLSQQIAPEQSESSQKADKCIIQSQSNATN
jgi:hypothetical protein